MKLRYYLFILLVPCGAAIAADTNAEVIQGARKTTTDQSKVLDQLSEPAPSTNVNTKTLRRQKRATDRRLNRRVNRR